MIRIPAPIHIHIHQVHTRNLVLFTRIVTKCRPGLAFGLYLFGPDNTRTVLFALYSPLLFPLRFVPMLRLVGPADDKRRKRKTLTENNKRSFPPRPRNIRGVDYADSYSPHHCPL